MGDNNIYTALSFAAFLVLLFGVGYLLLQFHALTGTFNPFGALIRISRKVRVFSRSDAGCHALQGVTKLGPQPGETRPRAGVATGAGPRVFLEMRMSRVPAASSPSPPPVMDIAPAARERLGAAGFPAAWTERLERLVPADRLGEAADHFLGPRPVAFRVNTLRADPRTVATRLAADGLEARAVAWSAAAFTVAAAERERLVRHPLVDAGDVYPQGLSSQLAAFVLDPRPEESVLDLCAAPGGKTLDLAQRLAAPSGGGDLAAVEASKPRFFRLRANLERAGAGWVRTYLHDGRRTGTKVPGRFDAVLLDAPCSGDTRLRGGDDDASAWSVKKARRLSPKQRQLLASAIRCTRPGGRVLYATCSLSPEENEAVVDAALREDSVEAEAFDVPPGVCSPGLAGWAGTAFHPGVSLTRRVLPAGPWEGFYLALLRVRGGGESKLA